MLDPGRASFLLLQNHLDGLGDLGLDQAFDGLPSDTLRYLIIHQTDGNIPNMRQNAVGLRHINLLLSS